MTRTKEIASFRSALAANEVAEILRANGIECSVESAPNTTLPSMGSYATTAGTEPFIRVFVSDEDEERAQEALEGALASRWFLRTPDGRRYHSFEAATVAVLRAHATNQKHSGDGFDLREVTYLADVMEQHNWDTVYQAFHEGHLFRRRERTVEGRTLDDWARSCGCAHAHRQSE